MRTLLISLLMLSATYADSIDEVMDGFDDEVTTERSSEVKESSSASDFGLTGTITEEAAYSIDAKKPHRGLSSLKSSLFLDYEHKFDNGFKFKSNAKAYYDSIYNLRDRDNYTKSEIDELESEIELFDAYIEGSLSDKLDFKIGRQVVVWGRSDTIRVTDVLNPIDNRRPAMVDIEDLRLPLNMAKFDYFIGSWRFTPIAIFEHRFTKNPPYGGGFNPSPMELPKSENYSNIEPAISVGGEFSNWDINFYASEKRADSGQLRGGKLRHDKVNMFGTALNLLSGSWLFKSEFAHFDGLKFNSTGDREFSRSDILFGAEYNGIADSLFSYDVVLRAIEDYDPKLSREPLPTKERSYQHAFRATTELFNSTLKVNYLISLYGSKLDEGGFERLWFDMDISDGVKATVGYVDYIGGSKYFDTIEKNDILFGSVAYSF